MDCSDKANTGLQILVLGLDNVGKTTIIQQLRKISAHIFGWQEKYRNTDADEWKTSSERLIFQEVTGFLYPSFQKLAIKKSDAFILTYAMNNRTSFEYAMSFIRQITAIRGKNVPIFVVGNKADTEEREVNPEIADYEVTMNYECTHVEICALDGDGLKDLFSCLLGHLGQYLVNPTKDESVEDKKQSLRKRLSNYFRKKLSTLNTF